MNADLQQLETFRKELHAHPEVSGNERETATRVQRFLEKCSPDSLLTEVGKHGIVATFDSGKEGPTLLFRAELDALPIREVNTFGHRSKYEGVSHMCGHDGHATVLCGLAQELAAERPKKGKVHLLFQPAEENGEGAKAMLADPKFATITPDMVFAFHNLPGYPLGTAVVRDGIFTAAVNSIIIHLKGKTAHAAEPEHGINPALAVADILKGSLDLAHNVPADKNMRVVTTVHVLLGDTSYGISADEAEVHLTVRCWDDGNLRKLERDIESLSKSIADQHDLKVSFAYTQSFHANRNDPEVAELVRRAAQNNGIPLKERDFPFKWGEDFGLFTDRFKGCMFGLGSGENQPALHNPDYDWPDQLTATGIRVFHGIIKDVLTD